MFIGLYMFFFSLDLYFCTYEHILLQQVSSVISEPKSYPSVQTFVSQNYVAPPAPQPAQPSSQLSVSPGISLEKDRVIPVRGLMRTMIKTMSESLQIPALGYSDEINMNDLIKLRLDLKPVAESKGVKVTFMPFLIKAVSMAINQYPIMNSSISKDMGEITIKVSVIFSKKKTTYSSIN